MGTVVGRSRSITSDRRTHRFKLFLSSYSGTGCAKDNIAPSVWKGKLEKEIIPYSMGGVCQMCGMVGGSRQTTVLSKRSTNDSFISLSGPCDLITRVLQVLQSCHAIVVESHCCQSSASLTPSRRNQVTCQQVLEVA